MQKNVLLDHLRLMEIASVRTTAEDGLPNPRGAPIESGGTFDHDEILTNCFAGTMLERSTIKSPSSLSHMRSHGKGPVAGPVVFAPSRVNWLPWHGQDIVPDSGFRSEEHTSELQS